MDTLNRTQARQLATLFTDFSAEIAKYRYDQWEKLTLADRQKLLDLEYDLMTEAGRLSALAGTLTLEAVQDAVDQINTAVSDAENFVKKVNNIKKGLTVITGVLSLVIAIAAKDPAAIFKELKALKKTIS